MPSAGRGPEPRAGGRRGGRRASARTLARSERVGVGEGAGTRCPGLGPEPLTASAPSRSQPWFDSRHSPPGPCLEGAVERGRLGPLGEGVGGAKGLTSWLDRADCGNGALVAPRGSQGASGGSQSVRAIHALRSSVCSELAIKIWGCPVSPTPPKLAFSACLTMGDLLVFCFLDSTH